MSLFTEADVATLRANNLFLLAQQYFANFAPTDPYLLTQILAAEAEMSRRLRVRFQPTTFFPYTPSDSDIAALPAGMLWDEEPGYDYDPNFFSGNSWGYIVTRQKPIISLNYIRFAYPSPTQAFFTIPADWPRIDKKYGHIRLVPASSAFSAPLSAFLMQALGGGDTIPGMIQVNYVAGLKDARDDWPDLINLILRLAALKVFQDAFIAGSASISADGLSQSLTVKMSDYEDSIERVINGPPKSNGGLKVAIHGIVGSIMGVVA